MGDQQIAALGHDQPGVEHLGRWEAGTVHGATPRVAASHQAVEPLSELRLNERAPVGADLLKDPGQVPIHRDVGSGRVEGEQLIQGVDEAIEIHKHPRTLRGHRSWVGCNPLGVDWTEFDVELSGP
ncbi:hypothetical protein [Micromonospora sp. AKA38]|uniref:hypothetical protein n=1 Tax=Micromonospora sp. AKA38 TaxID=2733861 RepID=UPI002492BBE3|nr:hypothetical protein [Micromonospora sp. AKA38]